jgi:hypothetical protein
MITNVARCASEIKSRISMTTAAFYKFTSKVHLNIKVTPKQAYVALRSPGV